MLEDTSIRDLTALMTAARTAYDVISASSAAQRRQALIEIASALRSHEAEILEANQRDLAHAEGNAAFLDRLTLTSQRLQDMAEAVERIAALPDPVGKVMQEWIRLNGLVIRQVSTPIGVIGMIFESCPNVGVDAAALCIKSGNAIILRGGSESFHSTQSLMRAVQQGLRHAGLPDAAAQSVPDTDRTHVTEMLHAQGQIDLLIPRGGKSLVTRVMQESRVPVLAHAEWLCHSFVNQDTRLEIARAVIANAKMRRLDICGATETLLLDRAIAPTFLPVLVADLSALGCHCRGDEAARAVLPTLDPASERDFATEWLDAELSIAIVDGVEGACAHIRRYGSGHTEAIITENEAAAEAFMRGVPSAVVMWNASTQFCDGGEFGFGGEIGISTGWLHARGPVGVAQLTTYRYEVRGDGQTRP
ncbi:MAG: glutamate-5-semialdehyde dehydrogenase [Acetobacteraceae bacterium]